MSTRFLTLTLMLVSSTTLCAQLSIFGREFYTDYGNTYALDQNPNTRITFALSTLGEYVLLFKGAGLSHETGRYEVRGDTLLLIPDLVKILNKSLRTSTDSAIRIEIFDDYMVCVNMISLKVFSSNDSFLIQGNEFGIFHLDQEIYDQADSITYNCPVGKRFDIKKLKYDASKYNLRLRVLDDQGNFIRSKIKAFQKDGFVVLRGDTLFRLNYDVAH